MRNWRYSGDSFAPSVERAIFRRTNCLICCEIESYERPRLVKFLLALPPKILKIPILRYCLYGEERFVDSC